MSDKGISLMSLIVTIIIIILLAAIGGYYAIDSLDKSERMNAQTELRNVEELVSIQKAKIVADVIEIPDTYKATSEQINKFSKVLSSSDINKVKTNGKYYYMNQSRFDELFSGDTNVKDVKKEYLINFEDKVIISSAGSAYMVGEIK